MEKLIKQRIFESISVKTELLEDCELISNLCQLAQKIEESIANGGKLIICGNGGSASDAMHFAGEITGRFQKERKPWPAVVLNSNEATMTAIANDYGYDDIFSRQTEAFAKAGDVFVGISTSGNSENVLRAIEVANAKGVTTAAFLGNSGGKIAALAECPLIVRSKVTARVQECHIMLIHILCEIVESDLSKNE